MQEQKMTPRKLIELLQALPEAAKDLPVMGQDLDGESVFSIASVTVRTSHGEFDDDWNMPKGYKWVNLNPD